ncbi:MAG: hypothetical protein Rubg2KO_39370 [Rubricoccaceae bacterium]
MLMPKRTKFRKMQKGRVKGLAQRGARVTFGDYGIKALDAGWITSRQIEAARIAMTRHMKRAGKVWIRVFPDKPITKKPAETRMGKGKGSPEYWVAVVKPGRILFEVAGVSEEVAREAMRLAIQKLPIKAKFVIRPEANPIPLSKADQEAADAETAAMMEASEEARAAEPDDLTKIRGVGEVFQDALRAAGLDSYQAVADADLDALRAAIEEGTDTSDAGANEETWAAQARFLADGDIEGLNRFNDAEKEAEEEAVQAAAPEAESGPDADAADDADVSDDDKS